MRIQFSRMGRLSVVLLLSFSISALCAVKIPKKKAVAAEAKPWVVSVTKGSGETRFKATGYPSALVILGTGAPPKGEFQVLNGKLSGELTLDLKTLDTGIPLRNRH